VIFLLGPETDESSLDVGRCSSFSSSKPGSFGSSEISSSASIPSLVSDSSSCVSVDATCSALLETDFPRSCS